MSRLAGKSSEEKSPRDTISAGWLGHGSLRWEGGSETEPETLSRELCVHLWADLSAEKAGEDGGSAPRSGGPGPRRVVCSSTSRSIWSQGHRQPSAFNIQQRSGLDNKIRGDSSVCKNLGFAWVNGTPFIQAFHVGVTWSDLVVMKSRRRLHWEATVGDGNGCPIHLESDSPSSPFITGSVAQASTVPYLDCLSGFQKSLLAIFGCTENKHLKKNALKKHIFSLCFKYWEPSSFLPVQLSREKPQILFLFNSVSKIFHLIQDSSLDAFCMKTPVWFPLHKQRWIVSQFPFCSGRRAKIQNQSWESYFSSVLLSDT